MIALRAVATAVLATVARGERSGDQLRRQDRVLAQRPARLGNDERGQAVRCDVSHPTRLSLKPGVIELLDALDDLRLARAIATSSAHHTVEHHLTAHNLAGRFHEIVGHGDYASRKPAPDSFLKAAERLGVEPRLSLVLEDSHNGVRSASSAGMITIMVPDLLEPTDEIRGLCTFVARDLHEVRSLILGSVSCR